MEAAMISEGLDPDDGSPLTMGTELPDGQTYNPDTFQQEMPVMTIGGAPFGDPVTDAG